MGGFDGRHLEGRSNERVLPEMLNTYSPLDVPVDEAETSM